jgi:hypothetical protein
MKHNQAPGLDRMRTKWCGSKLTPKTPRRPSTSASPPDHRRTGRGRLIANYWLRSGNTACVNGAAEFLRQTVQGLPTHIRIGPNAFNVSVVA